MKALYGEIAELYDLIYADKKYKKESEEIHRLIKKNKKSKGKELLDVACGTGNHIKYLKKHYQITGLDLNKPMLRIAKKKYPGIRFVQGNMISFNLKKKFDVIVCLFSAIGYAKTYKNLNRTIANFNKHLKEGGVLIFDPFFSKKNFKDGKVHADFVDRPDIKIARMNVSKSKGELGILNFHYLIATKKGVKYLEDTHELGLFEERELIKIMKRNGFKTEFKRRLGGKRGLYVGVKMKDRQR